MNFKSQTVVCYNLNYIRNFVFLLIKAENIYFIIRNWLMLEDIIL